MSKLRNSAKHRDCAVRIPGVCNFDAGTVVLAHLNGAGMGIKNDDLFAAFACSACHDAIDGRKPTQWTRDELVSWHKDGVFRTQKIWLQEGMISHK